LPRAQALADARGARRFGRVLGQHRGGSRFVQKAAGGITVAIAVGLEFEQRTRLGPHRFGDRRIGDERLARRPGQRQGRVVELLDGEPVGRGK
jgi:hypothetical protein